jgi:hypothetical protein
MFWKGNRLSRSRRIRDNIPEFPCMGISHRKASTYTQDNKNRINTHIFMTQVGFEPRLSVFKRAKTVCALEGTGTVIDCKYMINLQNS